MSDALTQYYCDEHGAVMKFGNVKAYPGITVTLFCPVCKREVFPDDPLTEIERQDAPAASFDDWKARDDMPVLDMGTIRLPEDAA